MNLGRQSFQCVMALLALGMGCSESSPSGGGTNASSTSGGTAGAGGTGSATTGTGGAATGAGGTSGGSAGTGTGSGGAGGTGGGSAGTGGQIGDASDGRDGGDSGVTSSNMTFFVSSEKSMTGNLGGLAGADARCQRLAAAVGRGSKTWRAYLSTEGGDANSGTAVNARDRIGTGPWHNSKGVMLAQDLTALHALKGDVAVFLDERGLMVPGQWAGSPTPNEHDVLTGSTAEGNVMAGLTCADWTSEASTVTAQVGHTDGLGPMMNPNPPYASWNSSHANGGCNDTAPRGGAGRIYCFAAD